MKNIPNLYNAMKTVEKACEPNEIAIIGEGATPAPLVLLGKCVDYINKMYGVDVLALLLAKMKEDGAPCACCADEDEDEDEATMVVVLDKNDLIEAVCLELPFVNDKGYGERISSRICDLVEGDELFEEDKEDYLISLTEQITVIIEEECSFLSEEFIEGMVDNIVDYIDDHLS